MKTKVKLYNRYTGGFVMSRVVYHGIVNNLGDRDEYYLDKNGEKRILGAVGLEIAPLDRKNVIRR